MVLVRIATLLERRRIMGRRRKESKNDLVELICAFDQLPLALNSAVKAAEDRVLDLKKHYGAAQDVAEEARRMWEEAKRELERLEKECEVGK